MSQSVRSVVGEKEEDKENENEEEEHFLWGEFDDEIPTTSSTSMLSAKSVVKSVIKEEEKSDSVPVKTENSASSPSERGTGSFLQCQWSKIPAGGFSFDGKLEQGVEENHDDSADGFKFFVQEPPKKDKKTRIDEPKNCFAIDPVVLHTIELINYKEALEELGEKMLVPRKNLLVPEFPLMRCRPSFGGSLPELSRQECYLYMRKSVAALFAHVGFREGEAEALETMVDVVGEHYEYLCSILKKVHERRLRGKDSAAPGTLTQMLQIVQIGHVDELRKFYKKRVLHYHQRTLGQCLELKNKYLAENDSSETVN